MNKFGAFFWTVLTTIYIVAVILLGKMDIWADSSTLSGAYAMGVMFGVVLMLFCYCTIDAWKTP